MNQLESALILTLRETIPWESSLEIHSTGTLETIDPVAKFDAGRYQKRDRQLAFRDLINAAAVAEVSIRVSDVWNYRAIQPTLQGPVRKDLINAGSEQLFSGTNAAVQHVDYTSVPYDAAQFTDRYLYGRDSIIYEALAQACAIFANPPITSVDTAGTIPAVTAWSLAEGVAVRADINRALALNRDLFKQPDRNLADRDNQMAGYVARLCQVLKDPFQFAERIYVEVATVDPREPETYTFARVYWSLDESYVTGDEVFNQIGWYRALVDDPGEPTPASAQWLAIDAPTLRQFVGEPALNRRNRIVYDTAAKTLQWFRETTSLVHVPQIVALSIPGIAAGQTLDTLPQIPEAKDSQFWRGKAAQIVPSGEKLTDQIALDFTASDATTGGFTQVPAASLTVPDTIQFQLTGALQNGNHLVSVLVNPSPMVEIAGAQNIQGTSGTLGGATFAVNPATVLDGIQYLVVGGSGVVYNGGTVAPGFTFTGTGSQPSYLALGGSDLRQFSCAWRLALPVGPWTARIDYTNLEGNTTGFGVKATYGPASADPVVVFEDTVPLPFDATFNGSIARSQKVGFDVIDDGGFLFQTYWTYGNGNFQIRQITFESTTIEQGHYAMQGTLGGDQLSNVDVIGESYHPDILSFFFTTGSLFNPVFGVTWEADSQLPIQFKAIQVQTIGTYTPTPSSALFQGWRQEMTERATEAIQDSFRTCAIQYGTNCPLFRNDDGTWDGAATERWMSFIEVYQPRLREIEDITTGNITDGRQYQVDGGPIVYNGTEYHDGQRFYGLESEGRDFSGASLNQVGAMVKARPGHLGKPCIVPFGVFYDPETQETRAQFAGSNCYPVIAACQPWMIDVGIYIYAADFWMPENT
jgi:hypothetical protein